MFRRPLHTPQKKVIAACGSTLLTALSLSKGWQNVRPFSIPKIMANNLCKKACNKALL